MTEQTMTTAEIIKELRMMARYPTVTLPRDKEALSKAADLLQALEQQPAAPVIDESAAKRIATALGWEPKRKWVGLTDEEIIAIIEMISSDPWTVAEEIQARLKEKNT